MIVAHNRGSLRGQLRVNEPMSKHTSWRVGGCADCFYLPADIADLAMYLNSLDAEQPVHWLGLGSNLLVRDAGIRGCVIATSGALNHIQMVGEHRVRVDAGVAGAKVARFTVDHGLTGAQFLAGIPGTMGGALAMNAGAFGGETWDIVDKVETIDRQGRVRNRMRSDFTVGYRRVSGPSGEWFVAAHLRLAAGDAIEGKANIRTLLARRGQTQPTQIANAGSVFKNPPGDYAARLIEASGMKGFCIGKACVSQVHANFIVNAGGATAGDIEDLMRQVQKGVELQQGVTLETEVRIIGEA